MQALARFAGAIRPSLDPESSVMPTRSTDELRALSEHVLYDVQLFNRAVERLASHSITPSLPWDVEMVLLEGFATHARALTEFLYRDRARRADDGLAAEYFDNGEWARLRPRRPSELRQIPTRVGREIVHITYHRIRISEAAKAWNYGQVATALGGVVRVFVENVPEERVVPQFRKDAWEALPGHVRGREHFYKPPPAATGIAGPR